MYVFNEFKCKTENLAKFNFKKMRYVQEIIIMIIGVLELIVVGDEI